MANGQRKPLNMWEWKDGKYGNQIAGLGKGMADKRIQTLT